MFASPAFRTSRAGATLVAVSLLVLTAASCADDLADAPPPSTSPVATDSTAAPTTTLMPAKLYDIVGTALQGGDFTQLAGMALDAGLVDTLRTGEFTVFAPTNDAFRKLPLDVLHSVQDDPTLLATVLTYHVVPGTLMLADLQDGPLATVAGIDLTVSHDGDTVLIDGSPIVAGDVQATNGVIHVMGDVLVPDAS
ncbi:MAG: fasciclin domain-containing protein [Ilumatobacteraceae bacterium]